MNESASRSIIFSLTGTIVVMAIVLCLSINKQVEAPKSGSAHPGLAASVATTSNPTVTTSPSLAVATTTGGNCSARIITTYAQPIMITFSDVQGKVPSGTFGHYQPASTTVAYDSGLYGCDAVRIYSFASQAITVSETR